MTVAGPRSTRPAPVPVPRSEAPAPVCSTVVRRVDTPAAEVTQTVTTCVKPGVPSEATAADTRRLTAANEKTLQSQLIQRAGQRNVDRNSYPAVAASKTTPYGYSSPDVVEAQALLNRYHQRPTTPKAGTNAAPKTEPLAEDGCLGPKTRAQLLAHQKAHNLPGGGDLNAETLASLKARASEGRDAATDARTKPGTAPEKKPSTAPESKPGAPPEVALETPQKRAQVSKLFGDTVAEWRQDPAAPEVTTKLSALKAQLDSGQVSVGAALQQFRALNSEHGQAAVDKAQREAAAWETAANVTRVVRDGSVVLAGALTAPVLGVPGTLAAFSTATLAGTGLSVGSSALSAASAPEAERSQFLDELKDPSKHLTLGVGAGLATLTMPTTISPFGAPLPPGSPSGFSGVTIDVPAVLVR